MHKMESAGVSINFLKEFIQHKNYDENISTAECFERIIKPQTIKKRIAYIDLFKSKKDSNGIAYVAKANVFVSHAWRGNIQSSIDAMLEYPEGDRKFNYFWFDLFVNNQHTVTQNSHEWWETVFRRNIGKIGNTLLVFVPWDDPIVLQRVWCLFEIICSIQGNTTLTIAIPSSQEVSFQKALLHKIRGIVQTLSDIDSENAKATIEHDKQMIFEVIKKTISFNTLNKIIKDELRKWILSKSMLLAEKYMRETNTSKMPECIAFISQVGLLALEIGDFKNSEMYLKYAVENGIHAFKDDPLNLGIAINNLGSYHESKGEYDIAVKLYEKALSLKLSCLDETNIELASTMNNIGSISLIKGDLERAEDCFKKTLAISLARNGEKHHETAKAFNNLGAVYDEQNRDDLALENYEKSLEIRKEILGINHPETAASFNNCGSVYYQAEKYDEALENFTKSFSILSSVLGDTNPKVAVAIENIGQALEGRGEYKEAMDKYKQSLSIKEVSLGPEHLAIAESYYSIGMVSAQMKAYRDAIENLQRCLQIREIHLKARHPDIRNVHKNLSVIYYNMGKLDKSEKHEELSK